MATFEPADVQIATLKARNAQLLLELADLGHVIRMHALHGLADAHDTIETLRERLAGEAYEHERATLKVLDAQLSNVEHHLRERRCACSQVDRVALALADEPEPGKVVPLRKFAVVRKPTSAVRDLLAKVLGKDDEPNGGGAA